LTIVTAPATSTTVDVSANLNSVNVSTDESFSHVVVTGTPTAPSSTPSGTLTIVAPTSTAATPANAATVDISAVTGLVDVTSTLNFNKVVVTGTPTSAASTATGTLTVVTSTSTATSTKIDLSDHLAPVDVRIDPTPTLVIVQGNDVSNSFSTSGIQLNDVEFHGGTGENVFTVNPTGGHNITVFDPPALTNIIDLQQAALPT